MEVAQKEGKQFCDYIVDNYCSAKPKPFELSYSMIKDYIDPVVADLLTWTWDWVNPPIPLQEALSFYKELKRECILRPELGAL